MTSHCYECNLTLADNEDCLHIKGGRMFEDEHAWHRQYDRPLSPRWRLATLLGLIVSGAVTIVGISMAVNWFVEKAL